MCVCVLGCSGSDDDEKLVVVVYRYSTVLVMVPISVVSVIWPSFIVVSMSAVYFDEVRPVRRLLTASSNK